MSAPTDSNCTVQTSGAKAPASYVLGAVSITGTGILDAATGAFKVPVGGIQDLKIQVTLTSLSSAPIPALSDIALAVLLAGCAVMVKRRGR